MSGWAGKCPVRASVSLKALLGEPKDIPRVTSPDTLHGFTPGHTLYLLARMSCEE